MYTSHVARFALVLLSCRSGVRHATSARGNAALLATPAAPASSARGTAAPLASPVVPAFFQRAVTRLLLLFFCHRFFLLARGSHGCALFLTELLRKANSTFPAFHV